MGILNIIFIVGVLQVLSSLSNAQTIFRICATDHNRDDCLQLERGNSEVKCQWVQDSIECAQRIKNKTSDFGIFTAESILHMASLNWNDLVITHDMKHRDRMESITDYESVVIVSKDFEGGIENLAGKKYCHPGLYFSKGQRWSERFLKYLERTLLNEMDCPLYKNESYAEIEIRRLSKYFSSACRPGFWSLDPDEDIKLKTKYSNLCSLCDGTNCNYENKYGHAPALRCLESGGEIAYVSAEDAEKFLATNNKYRYLCTNGTISSDKCVWLRQPWGGIITHKEKANEIQENINKWMNAIGNDWQQYIRNILTADSYIPKKTLINNSPTEHFRFFQEIPQYENKCKPLKWCIVSEDEQHKCEIIKHAGITTGMYPQIECPSPSKNEVECLKEISEGKSDFMGIDSNFGYIARQLFNLTNVLYAETEASRYSSVVVVTKESSQLNFENLRNTKACLPEFGGIASIAFANIGKSRGFLSSNECDHGRLLGDYFAQVCAPGAQDHLHDPLQKNPNNLCSLCLESAQHNSNIDIQIESNMQQSYMNSDSDNLGPNCAADLRNKYYDNKGAFRCLSESGDIAVMELQALKEISLELNLNPKDFRLICRNGSLARYPGFDVDISCALTTIVDGEIIAKPNDVKIQDITNILLLFTRVLNNDPLFRMYNIFESKRNLLFKDSTISLTKASDSSSNALQNYIQLFQNVENCVQGKNNSNYIKFNFLALIFVILIFFM